MARTGEPQGRRALFEAAQHDGHVGTTKGYERGGQGRQALFSAGQRRPGMVVVECSRCQARTPISLLALAWQLVPSVWLPGRRWPRWMRCPTCHRLAWCRVGWRDALPLDPRRRPA
jgi:hypothetical protein